MSLVSVLILGKKCLFFFFFSWFDLRIRGSLNDGPSFSESLLIHITGFLDSLDFARIVTKAQFIGRSGVFKKNIFFNTWTTSLNNWFEYFAAILDLFDSLTLVVFSIDLSIDFFFLNRIKGIL